jgi:hypothetical protein
VRAPLEHAGQLLLVAGERDRVRRVRQIAAQGADDVEV